VYCREISELFPQIRDPGRLRRPPRFVAHSRVPPRSEDGQPTAALPAREAHSTCPAISARNPGAGSNGRATSDRGSTPLHDAGEPADRLVPPQQLHDLEQIRRARAASIYQYSVQRDGTKLIGNFSNALLITASARTMSGAPSRRFAQPTATD